MKAKYLLPLLLAALLLPAGLISAVGLARNADTQPRAPVGPAFTYQGLLTGDGDPVAGPCDFQFALWDDPISGTLVAGPLEQTGVPLAAGRFTVQLDFGAVFDGTALWLDIAAQCPGDPGYVPLTPRQALTAAPYAQAVSWYGVYDMPAGFADSVDDDTLYDAGTGLALAGTTFSITPTYRLPQACAGGQVAKWNGAAWNCANDDMSIVISGTNIFAGEGLYAVTQSNSITLNVFFGGNGSAGSAARSDHDHAGIYAPLVHTHAGEDITSGTVADARIAGTIARDTEITPTVWANDGAGSGLDADLLDGLHGTSYQARVAGACTVGSTVRAINTDGTVVCQVDAPLNRPNPPVANTITTLDSAGNVGTWSSVTIGADGLGLIGYYDDGNADVKVAHCSDVLCTSATLTTLDSAGGAYISVAIGADGLGLISYYDDTNDDLKVAHCSNVACTAATITSLDSAGDVGQYTSIAIGTDGLGLIGYYDNSNGDLKVAHCSSAACTSATLSTLDSNGNVGGYNSVIIGTDGLGLISYYDGTNADLKVAHCSNVLCTSATITTVDSAGLAGVMTSVVLGTDGLGLVSYRENTWGAGELRVAHCNNVLCTSAITTTLDGVGDPQWTSITIGPDGLGFISYYNSTDLKIAHCSNVICTVATLLIVDSGTHVGTNTSVTIDVDGLPLISYLDYTNWDLKVVHCSNAFCVPYWRQR